MRRILLASSVAAVLFAAGIAGVGAAPFLCPVMGEGALGAPGLDGSHKNTVGEIGVDTGIATIVPGNNKAGENANESAPTRGSNSPKTSVTCNWSAKSCCGITKRRN